MLTEKQFNKITEDGLRAGKELEVTGYPVESEKLDKKMKQDALDAMKTLNIFKLDEEKIKFIRLIILRARGEELDRLKKEYPKVAKDYRLYSVPKLKLSEMFW